MVENISLPLAVAQPMVTDLVLAEAAPWNPDLPLSDMLGLLVVNHHARFYSLASTIVRAPDSPDDLIQDGLECVLQRSQNLDLPPLHFRAEEQLVAYVGKTIIHKAISRNRRFPTYSLEPNDERFDSGRVDEGVGTFELIESLRTKGIDPRCIDAYLLDEVAGLSQQEVADMLGVPKLTVDTRIKLVRRRLESARKKGLLDDLRMSGVPFPTSLTS